MLQSPGKIKGVGKKYLEIFSRYAIDSVYDLLTHFPDYYIDTATTDNIIEPGIKKIYTLNIKKTNLYRNYRKRLTIINISGNIGEDDVDVIIFNKPYLFRSLKESDSIKIFGKIVSVGIGNRMENPRIIDSDKRIIPVYKNIGSIKGGTLRNIIENILSKTDQDEDVLPQRILNRYNNIKFWDLIREIHSPKLIPEKPEELKKRFIYTEFLLFQLEIAFIRKKSGKVKRGNKFLNLRFTNDFLTEYVKFNLTTDQKKAVKDIIQDLNGKFTMQRILLGDVGSGKTIIAFLFLLIAAINGYQGVFLAPTEVLVNQHFESAVRFFKGINIAILTGNTPVVKRKKIIENLKRGEIRIIFGTHSLINEKIVFSKLSSVVIDEQHRFGVAQRAALFYKGQKADLLVTTATPIPRTLLLSLYNDLDVSKIKSMPLGRLPIQTLILRRDIREKFYTDLKVRINNGEKVFIVLPLISRSFKFPHLRSLESEEYFFENVFKKIPFGKISGKMSYDERKSNFKKFSTGEIKVLLSTTVIEVGIDIKDATIMIIEDADRFGLSQLHQLRGRVGRGSRQSYCYLFPSEGITEGGKKRLKIIRDTTDGFVIAEEDLGMRGGGNIAGFEQSGYLDFKLANIKEYPELFMEARKDASVIIRNKSMQSPFIKDKLKQLESKTDKISFS